MTAPTPTPAVPSLIQALHARFEANNREGTAIEKAQADEAETEFTEQGRLQRALDASQAESDTLRYAILTQIPDDRTDALIFAYHVRLEQDFQANLSTPFARRDPRPGILSNAVDALFDFMCRETDIDHGEIGPDFQEAANRVLYARRYRTGVVEG